MGHQKSRLLTRKSKCVNILFLGLDGAGKTAILLMLSSTPKDARINVIQPVSTKGVSIIPLNFKGVTLLAHDLGGTKSERTIWRSYYKIAHGIVYVIDASNRNRFEEVGVELHKLLEEEDLRGIPILFCANKQDHASSVGAQKLADGLNLHLIRARRWHIHNCSAQTRLGLDTAISWLVYTIVEMTVKTEVLIRIKSRKQTPLK